MPEDGWETTYALPCVDADGGVVADDELVVFMLLHGYLLRRTGADLNLPPNENKAVPAHSGKQA